MLTTYIHSPGKTLALSWLVHSNAHCMLGDTVDSSSVAMVTLVGRSCVNSARSLDVHNITVLIDAQGCGQRNDTMFSERPREHRAGASLPFCYHFGELVCGTTATGSHAQGRLGVPMAVPAGRE